MPCAHVGGRLAHLAEVLEDREEDHLGFGRIVAPEMETPNMLENLG